MCSSHFYFLLNSGLSMYIFFSGYILKLRINFPSVAPFTLLEFRHKYKVKALKFVILYTTSSFP